MKKVLCIFPFCVVLLITFQLAYADIDVPFEIPQRTIIVDGQPDDWAGINPIVQDDENDSTCPAGTDIDYVFLAQDNNFLYWRIDFFGQMPIITGTKYQPGIRVCQVGPDPSDRTDGDIETKLDYHSGVIGFIEQFNASTYNWDNLVEDSEYGAAGDIAEGKIPLDLFSNGTFVFIDAWVHNGVLSSGVCDQIFLTSIDDSDGDDGDDGDNGGGGGGGGCFISSLIK